VGDLKWFLIYYTADTAVAIYCIRKFKSIFLSLDLSHHIVSICFTLYCIISNITGHRMKMILHETRKLF